MLHQNAAHPFARQYHLAIFETKTAADATTEDKTRLKSRGVIAPVLCVGPLGEGRGCKQRALKLASRKDKVRCNQRTKGVSKGDRQPLGSSWGCLKPRQPPRPSEGWETHWVLRHREAAAPEHSTTALRIEDTKAVSADTRDEHGEVASRSCPKFEISDDEDMRLPVYFTGTAGAHSERPASPVLPRGVFRTWKPVSPVLPCRAITVSTLSGIPRGDGTNGANGGVATANVGTASSCSRIVKGFADISGVCT